MSDVSLDKLLGSLVQHVSDMRQDLKNLDDTLRKLPHETAPDLRPDLKKIYQLCSQLSEGEEFKDVIAEQAQDAIIPLKEDLLEIQREMKRRLSDQLHKVSEGIQRLSFTFNAKTATLASCLTAGAFSVIFISGYALRYYQDKALINQADRDLSFSALQFKIAKSIEFEGQEMINGNKTLKEFVKNGNNPGWLKCKGQGAIRYDANGRRICTIDVWLDPSKK